MPQAGTYRLSRRPLPERFALPRVLQANLPHVTKGQAVWHLTNYLVHPLMLWPALTTPWLLHIEPVVWRPTHLLTTVGASVLQ
jgi:hypothetical protein